MSSATAVLPLFGLTLLGAMFVTAALQSRGRLPFAVPEGATTATLTFDLLGIDDLSGDTASIMINGQEVALYADNHGNITTTDLSGSGVTVEVSQLYNNDPMGAGSHGHDSRATYTITVDNPGETVTFGVASGTGQPISEEFYAIDDVNFVTG